MFRITYASVRGCFAAKMCKRLMSGSQCEFSNANEANEAYAELAQFMRAAVRGYNGDVFGVLMLVDMKTGDLTSQTICSIPAEKKEFEDTGDLIALKRVMEAAVNFVGSANYPEKFATR